MSAESMGMERLFTLLAMGNWGNTPSPPLDPDAPDSVGNEGELHLEMSGRSHSYLIESARLTSEALVIEGEAMGGLPVFRLSASLPEGVGRGATVDAEAWRGKTCPIHSASFPELEEETVSGSLRLLSITGANPWEIDAELELTSTSGDSGEGKLQARLRT